MTKIRLYPIDDTISGDDKWIGTDSASPIKATKNFTVDSVAQYASLSDLGSVGLNFKWSLQDPDYKVSSTHIDHVAYTKLRVDFQNINLNDGASYKLILERHKRNMIRNSTDGSGTSFRKGGYKRANPLQVYPAPYADRLSEIAITDASGQLFDFRFDLFFRNGNDFPGIAGGGKNFILGALNQICYLPIAFRISRTLGSETTVSPILGKLTLLGSRSTINGNKISFQHN